MWFPLNNSVFCVLMPCSNSVPRLGQAVPSLPTPTPPWATLPVPSSGSGPTPVSGEAGGKHGVRLPTSQVSEAEGGEEER